MKTKNRPHPLIFTIQIVSRTSEWTSWCFQKRCACLCIYIPSVTNAQINTDKCVMEICVSRNQITGNCLWNLAICLRFSRNWQHIYTKLLCSRFFNGSFIQNSLKLYVKGNCDQLFSLFSKFRTCVSHHDKQQKISKQHFRLGKGKRVRHFKISFNIRHKINYSTFNASRVCISSNEARHYRIKITF